LRSGDKYLVERYELRILPSASVMEFLNQGSGKSVNNILVFGNPDLKDPDMDLPYAQLEAQKIGKLVSGSTVLLRNQATETAARTLGADFRYLHFASHGIFDPKHPLDSALLLAADSKNDGRLTVSELYETRINADLVTLSACETALGKITNGDDVVGFTRGFLYAGANSIVSSLWQVDDKATGILMEQFYRNLANTNKRSALRQAQTTMIASNHNHPFFWSAFQLTGSIN
jgi:CHAT domain-containing protein